MIKKSHNSESQHLKQYGNHPATIAGDYPKTADERTQFYNGSFGDRQATAQDIIESPRDDAAWPRGAKQQGDGGHPPTDGDGH